MNANTQENDISASSASLLTDLTGKKKIIAELALANVQNSEIAKRAQTTTNYVWKVKSELKKAGLLSGAVSYDKHGPENLSGLEDSGKLEQLGDEELKKLASQVDEAQKKAEASKMKYLARQEKDRLEAEAARYARMLEEHEALTGQDQLTAYTERVMAAKDPRAWSEIKKHAAAWGLTLKEFVRDELLINPRDFQFCKDSLPKYTGKPYSGTLAHYIARKVDSWLKYRKLEEQKARLKPFLDSHYPSCPKCGLRCLEGTESGEIACLVVTCRWRGQFSCLACSAPMRYNSLYKALECTNDYCGLEWKLRSI